PGGLADHPGLETLDRPGLVQVQCEALRLALDDVGQHDGVEDVVLGEALRGRRAVEPGPDDGHLALALSHGVAFPEYLPVAGRLSEPGRRPREGNVTPAVRNGWAAAPGRPPRAPPPCPRSRARPRSGRAPPAARPAGPAAPSGTGRP